MRHRRFRNRRGSVLVMVALMLVALMVVTAIVLDIGRFYVVSNEMHTALDAAALSGAQVIQHSTTTGDAALRTEVQDHVMAFVAARYKVDNEAYSVFRDSIRLAYWDAGYTEPEFDYLTMSPPKRPNAVAIRWRKDPPVIFAGIFGRSSPRIWRRSVAWVANFQSANCVRPWAMPYTSFYNKVTGNSLPWTQTGAPEVSQLEMNSFLASTASNLPARRITILGSNKTSTNPSEGRWMGFNFNGNAGRPNFVDGVQGCRWYSVQKDASVGVSLPGQANQYNDWTTSVIWSNVGGGGGPGSGGDGVCYRNTANDAGCYEDAAAASAGTPGVEINAVWGDETGVGSNTIAFRLVGKIKLMCYFATTSARCPASGSPAGRETLSYPEGSVVLEIQDIGFRPIAPDDELGGDMGLEQRILLVK